MQAAVIERELLTIPEAADLLRVGRSTVYAMIAAGQLPRLKIRKAVRLRRADVELIAKNGTEAD